MNQKVLHVPIAGCMAMILLRPMLLKLRASSAAVLPAAPVRAAFVPCGSSGGTNQLQLLLACPCHAEELQLPLLIPHAPGCQFAVLCPSSLSLQAAALLELEQWAEAHLDTCHQDLLLCALLNESGRFAMDGPHLVALCSHSMALQVLLEGLKPELIHGTYQLDRTHPLARQSRS